MVTPLEDTLTWEDSYAIALALHKQNLYLDLEQVSLEMVFRWTVALPDFKDDPNLSNDAILMAIYREWLEIVDFDLNPHS